MDNMVNLDFTVVIQIVNFLVSMVAINFLLIRPVRRQIAARRAFTEGQAGDIQKLSEQSDAKLSGYEASIAEARSQAAVGRESLKAEGQQQEQDIVGKAHDQAQAFLRDSRGDIERERKTALESLTAQVPSYANAAVSRILA